jgi:hypothetical protein
MSSRRPVSRSKPIDNPHRPNRFLVCWGSDNAEHLARFRIHYDTLLPRIVAQLPW